MTEWEKMRCGQPFFGGDPELVTNRTRCRSFLHALNSLCNDEPAIRHEIIKGILGKDSDVDILPPFHCDFGICIEIGDGTRIGKGCVILDPGVIKIGKNCFLDSNVKITAVGHPIHPEQRAVRYLTTKPVTIGDNVWIDSGANIMPGVTIGDNCIIGAGSVVTKDIPPNSIAMGSPCVVVGTVKEKEEKSLYFERIK